MFYKGFAQCKPCYISKVKKYRGENVEKIKEYDKERANLPHRVKARLDYTKTEGGIKAGNKAKIAYTERNQIKRGASTMVRNAVRDGKLIKPDNCSDCGNEPKRLHGHHDNYAYPLVVRWLCAGCHSAWHRANGAGLNG